MTAELRAKGDRFKVNSNPFICLLSDGMRGYGGIETDE
jgi:hypothetical protein